MFRPGGQLSNQYSCSLYSLQCEEILGAGAFGVVKKGYAVGLGGRMEAVVVAVKMLKCKT